MPIIEPTPIGAAPDVPDRSDRATFPARMFAAFTYLFGVFRTGANNLGSTTYTNATEAFNAASTATVKAGEASAAANAAAASSNAVKWVAGTTYAEGVVTWSPINHLSYRRKLAGAGSTDPSLDNTNWEPQGGTSLATLHATALLF